MKLSLTCPRCQKSGVELFKSEYLAPFKKYVNHFSCGHSQLGDKIETEAVSEAKYLSVHEDKAAYDYQKKGIEFIEATNYDCLIADAMGLGKTIQSILAARGAKKNFKRILVIVKSATTFQWCREIKDWYSDGELSVCPIIGSQTPIIPMFDIYVISMDTLARNGTYKKLIAVGIDLVIVDECHSFKDPDAKRTHCLIKLLKEGNIQRKIFLSGTPIKNRASEYFVILNLLRPDLFPSKARFERTWLIPNEKGAYTRLNPARIEAFKEMTSKFILRREKTEVLKNLPPFTRSTQFIEIEDPIIKASYNRELNLFDNFLNGGEKINSTQLLGWLAKLRRLTGMAKIPRTLEYTEEFLENFDSDKMAIGVHHHGVRDAMYHALRGKGYSALKLSGEDSAYQKDWLVQEFDKPQNRVLIINTLAGGVGLNLQMCSNCIIMERQWNAADEEQFESRFHRNGQERPVFADYLIAYGTIDQFFDEMVNEKRKIFGETLIANFNASSDEGFLRDLADRVIANPL